MAGSEEQLLGIVQREMSAWTESDSPGWRVDRQARAALAAGTEMMGKAVVAGAVCHPPNFVLVSKPR